MRDFFKSELESLKAKTGLNQYENLSAMEDAPKQFKILFDSLELVRKDFHYIPDEAIKQIIQEQIIRDTEFTSFNSRTLYKWLNAKKDYYWAAYQSKVETKAANNPVEFDKLPAHIQAEVNQFLASLASDDAGLKSVPSVSNEEIKAIENEDRHRIEKPKSLVAANPRPKFIVGRECIICAGKGELFDDVKELVGSCETCLGTGEVDRVEIQASSESEARKAYNQILK